MFTGFYQFKYKGSLAKLDLTYTWDEEQEIGSKVYASNRRLRK